VIYLVKIIKPPNLRKLKLTLSLYIKDEFKYVPKNIITSCWVGAQAPSGPSSTGVARAHSCLTTASYTLGHQLKLRLHLHQWPSMASHSAEPQLLCMTASCLQNQYHLGDSYTLPSPTTAQGTTLAISGTCVLSASVLSKNTSQKMSPQWCWSLLNHC
jgi:hypothetical protein